MEYPWDVVLIVLLIFIAVLLSFGIGFRAQIYLRYERVFKKQQKRYPNMPRSLLQAMTQLEQVTENRGRVHERSGDCDEGECAICLAALYSTQGDASSPSMSEVDLETGISRTTTLTTTTTATTKKSSDLLEQGLKAASWRPQPNDDEVLKMKRCRHMFHARCLATWYLRGKYSCPVCRATYYQVVVNESMNGEEDYRVQAPTYPAVAFW